MNSRIEKLPDPANFMAWAVQIKIHLIASKLLDVVLDTTSHPTKKSEYYHVWLEKDFTAQQIISSNVDQKLVLIS